MLEPDRLPVAQPTACFQAWPSRRQASGATERDIMEQIRHRPWSALAPARVGSWPRLNELCCRPGGRRHFFLLVAEARRVVEAIGGVRGGTF